MTTQRRSFLRQLGVGAVTATFGAQALARVAAATARLGPVAPEDAACNEDFWFAIQEAFTTDRSLLNLNNGGVSPSPRPVQEALARYNAYSNLAPAYTMWAVIQPQKEVVREQLARMFGCSNEEIAITRNSSEALETVIFGLELNAGDEVVLTNQDYPNMRNAWNQRALREGVVVKAVSIPTPCEDHDEIVRRYEQAIGPRTRVLHLCHVINLTGQVLPVRRLCELGRARGLEVIVDGAHAFAQLDFKRDDLQCDYYGTSLHKWLTAPFGTGFLYVRKDKIGPLWPMFAPEKPRSDDIRKFESYGTHPVPIVIAIGDAVAFHEGIGSRRKEERLRYLRDYWAKPLCEVPRIRFHSSFQREYSCAIATVEIEGMEPADVHKALFEKHRIYTTGIVHDEFKGIRVTPNVYTTLGDLDRFVAAMREIAAA
ncbi:MAG: aminotransferase class V-fold PLP-dependent enzyme [Planctomycetota bacterium]